MKRLKQFLPLLMLVTIVVIVFASGATRFLNLDVLQEHEAGLRTLIGQNLVLALTAFVGIYAVSTAISLPGASVLTLAGGYLFGTWIGGSATIIGATLGAVGIYYAVGTSIGAALRERAESSGGKLKAVIDGVQRGAFGYILTLRLIPVVPFWFVNVAAALAGTPIRAYVLATFFGIMPATFIYSGIGAGIGSIIADGGTPDLGVIFEPRILAPLLALALLSLGTTLYRGRRNSKEPQL